MKRGAIIFVSILLGPAVFAYALGWLGSGLRIELLRRIAFVSYIWWKALVFPHDGMHPREGLASSRTFPGVLAPLDALTQWAIVLVLLSWFTRRLSPAVQFAVSAMAIVVVGTVFILVMNYLGAELENMSI
jgi:hypothetical protein